MHTFDKMYGKACLQGQIVLHVDSSSGFKNEVDLSVSRVVFEKLCWKNRCKTDRSVCPGETLHKAPGPILSTTNGETKQTTNSVGPEQKRGTPAKQLSCGWIPRQEACEWEGTSAFVGKPEVYAVNSESSSLIGTQRYVLESCEMYLWEFAGDPTLYTRRVERKSFAILWSSLFPLQVCIRRNFLFRAQASRIVLELNRDCWTLVGSGLPYGRREITQLQPLP